MPITAPASAPNRVRLHITPFNPDIYDRVVSSAAKAVASGISYHAVQTQPERGFGYVELPKDEADKLKKKMHGTTLKGTKVRVEEAKPEKKRKAERDETEDERTERKKAKKAKKARREEGVIPGYELEDGRHVKRGWSEEKHRSGDKKSKDGKKMRFKTSVPPNAMPLGDEKDENKKSKSKDKKAKKESKDGEKKSHKTQKVVEEFGKKKPVIIAAEGDSKGALQYMEGKGWVNEEGEIVEAEPLSVKRQRAKEEALRVSEEARRAREEASQAQAMEVDGQDNQSEAAASSDDDEASAEDASDSVSSASEDESEGDASKIVGHAKQSSSDTAAAISGKAGDGPSEVATEQAYTGKLATPVPEPAREVHPLEALYKRAQQTAPDEGKPKPPPIDTSFSFFNPDDIEEDENEVDAAPALPPQTPHTKQDLEWRALRSAAPTPDTAGLGKRFRFAMDNATGVGSEDDEDEEMADDVPKYPATAGAADDGENKEESDFRKWFYEHRGDNNRAWKKQRKEAKKQQRQRENRRLTRRVV